MECFLFDCSRRPNRRPNRIRPKVEHWIIELCLKIGWGDRNLRSLLAQEVIYASDAAVDRGIARNGVIRENDK